MSWARDETQPSPAPVEGWFEPTPEKLTTKLAATRERCGEMSVEYVSLLVQIGDAHMIQGRLSNPHAQASYEAALQILLLRGGQSPEVAWLYDKLANVKESSGDIAGARGDLEKALTFWKNHPPANAIAPAVAGNHITRREEDFERLTRVHEFKLRTPPEA